MAFFASGRVWERDVVDPIRLSGYREFKWPDGTKYIGDWHNNLQHGQGVYTFPDGTQYVGLWHEGVPHGHGARSYRDGSSFEGDFFTGKRHGNGRLVYPNGDTFEGTFRDDLPWGKGVVTSRLKKGAPLTKLHGKWEGTEFVVHQRSHDRPSHGVTHNAVADAPKQEPVAEPPPQQPALLVHKAQPSIPSKSSVAKAEMKEKMGQGMHFLLDPRYPQHPDDMLPVAWSVTWPVLNWVDEQIDAFAGRFKDKRAEKSLEKQHDGELSVALAEIPVESKQELPTTEFDAAQPYVNGSVEQWDALKKSALSDTELHQIWELSDCDKDGLLDYDEFKVALYQVKLKLDGKELPKPRLSDAVQNSDKAIGHAISNSTVATSAKRFDVYLKQLSNETVRKYDTPEFVETVKKLQMGIVHGTDLATFRQIYDSLIRNTHQSIEQMRASLATIWDEIDVKHEGVLETKYLEPLIVRFLDIQQGFLSNQIYHQLNGLLPLFDSPNISADHRSWLDDIVRTVVDKKVLPAVVTVVEQVSSNMRQSLPTFQKELLNVIHMNSTHSDQVIERRMFVSTLSTAFKHLAKSVGETIADRSLELIVTTLAVAHLAEKGQLDQRVVH